MTAWETRVLDFWERYPWWPIAFGIICGALFLFVAYLILG